MYTVENRLEHGMGFFEFLFLVKRHFLAILLAGIAAAALSFAISYFGIAPVYEASAKMIVNTREDSTQAVTNDQITSAQKLVDTYAIILRSRTVLLPVIENLQLQTSYEALSKRISVSSVNETQIMEITVRNADSHMAEEIVAEILTVAPAVILETVEAGSVRTVEEPYCSGKAVFPNVALNTLLAFLLGAVIAAAVVVFRKLLHDAYQSAAELRQDLGLPVLGVLPDADRCRTEEKKQGEDVR